MWNSIVEEPTHKKKKMSPPSYGLSSLTDDIVLRCLSRVSRSDQPFLSRVCKSYRSLVASPELYKTRKLYGCTENSTYVCVLAPPDPIPRWFILSRDRHLSPIPSFPSQAEEGSSVVVLNWGIYIIGGIKKGKYIPDVLLLDCRTHTWHRLPSMGIGRCSAATGVVGGKIYVFGGCDGNSPNWAECFDPMTQTWITLPPIPDLYTRYQYTHSSVVVRDEKVYAVDLMERTFYYSPNEGKWGRGSCSEELGIRRDWCVIDKIIYTCDRFGNLCWCEIEQLERQGEEELMNWRKVQGLDSLQEKLIDSRLIHFDWKLDTLFVEFMLANGQNPKLIDWYPGVRLSNSGPNIVVYWDVIEGDHHDIWTGDYLQIWSAEVSLERRRNGTEIWGSIEWSHPVLTVDPFFHRYKIKAKVPRSSIRDLVEKSRIGYSHFSGKLHPNRRSTFEDVQLFYTLGKELARSRAIWVTCLCTDNSTGKQYAEKDSDNVYFKTSPASLYISREVMATCFGISKNCNIYMEHMSKRDTNTKREYP